MKKQRVKAVALNPVDYKVAEMGVAEWTAPFVLAQDMARVVESNARRSSIGAKRPVSDGIKKSNAEVPGQ